MRDLAEMWDYLCSELGILEDKKKQDIVKEYGRVLLKKEEEEWKRKVGRKTFGSEEDVKLCSGCLEKGKHSEMNYGENDTDSYYECVICGKTDFVGEVKAVDAKRIYSENVLYGINLSEENK
jgi:hypothetical protein